MLLALLLIVDLIIVFACEPYAQLLAWVCILASFYRQQTHTHTHTHTNTHTHTHIVAYIGDHVYELDEH